MPDVAKRRRWTRLEAVSWIAFRDHAAVRAAAKIETRTSNAEPIDPFWHLAVEGALGVVRQKGEEESDKPGIAIAGAIQHIESAERAGRLVADASGRFCVAEIKELFRSKEGRGRGQQQRGQMSYPDVADDGTATYAVETLGRFFLTNQKSARGAKHNWLGLSDWCVENRLVTSQKQYEKLRPQALSFAQRELELRRHHNVGVSDSRGPLTPEEYEQCCQNLASWRKPGRPNRGG